MRRVFLLVLVATLAVVVPARPAAAHAVLRAADPQDRQVMPEAPARVLLRFSEAVAVSATSVRVLDHHGDTVVGRGAAHVPGDDSQVELRLPDLEHGTYVVAWRVVSADSHPAVGAFSFRVGDATDDFHVGANLLAVPEGNRTVGMAFGVARFTLFSSIILLVGSVAFLTFVWPDGRARRGPRRLVAAAWLLAVVATVAAAGLQGAYASGGGLSDVTSTTVLTDMLGSRYGDASGARLVLLLDAAVLVLVLRARAGKKQQLPTPRVPRPVVMAAALTLLVTVSWVGHASTGRFVGAALVLDVVHLAAVSVWLGGLVTLVSFVLRRGDHELEATEAVVRRFSNVAFAAVVVIVVTGSLQSWRQLDGVGELTSTTFGRLLLVKIVLVAAMLVAARFSRRLVRRPLAAPAVALSLGPGAVARTMSDPVPRLRRWVAAEVAIAVVVIAVTTALVNAVPARSASEVAGPALPFSADLVKQGVKISVTLEPARTGLDDLHVYVISAEGRALDALEVSASLRLPAGDTGPINVPLVENAPGHWSAFGFPIPIAGTWQLEVAALVTEIDLVRVRTDVPIR